jgi:Ca-activated chloride channel family protein
VHDLLQARGKAKTALIAYAGSAHLVMPATDDSGIIDTFAAALSPKLMPVEGDDAAAALQLADKSLARAGGGSIVWITDGVSAEQADALHDWRRSSGTNVQLWPPLLPGEELDLLQRNARPVNPELIKLTADDSDIAALATAARFAPTRMGGSETRWAESGYWLSPLLALLMLAFFRAGWLVPPKGAVA